MNSNTGYRRGFLLCQRKKSFFSHLKTEKLYLEKPQNLEQLRSQITEYISLYNMERSKTNWATSPQFNSRKKSPLIIFYCLLGGAMTTLRKKKTLIH
ncbi:hypothetical protein C0Q44_08115 [Paenibacillus sp. PCH8]|uniref:IS3 family transposase n=1 Tax=Paenibacillus sp. PCH8 TaxID=2066524 RepID=UPI000CFA6EDB|nr:hypothetical protein C0Q44_08115 [Paenibacillus sp. PCH8]